MAARQVELIVRRSGQPEKRVPLGSGVTHMGRADDNDLVLPDIGVSRRHARIVVDETSVRFEDLGSGNGSFHRGRRIESQAIADGDEIVIEPFVLQFRIAAAAAMAHALEDDETLRAPPADALGAPARLVVLAGHRLASAYPLGGDPVAMGRSEAREIVLYDPAASRNHARVELRAEGYWLIDNQSANGTYVNGRRVQNHPLSTGDVVRIGSTEFRFELLGALPMPEQPGEAPTIRAPEPPPPVTAPPPVQTVPPQHAPAPVLAGPTGAHAPVQPQPESTAEERMWARGANPAALADEPVDPVNRGGAALALGVAAMVAAAAVVAVAGIGGFLYWQGQQVEAQREARKTQATAYLASLASDSPALDSGKVQFHEGRYLDAVKTLYGLVKNEPDNFEAGRMGFVAVEHMLLDAVVIELEQKAASPRERSDAAASAHRSALRALAGKSDLSEALAAVEAAVRLNPDSTQLRSDRKKLLAARTAASEGTDLGRLRDKVAPIYERAETALAAGASTDAAADYKKVQKADPAGLTWYAHEAAYGLAEAGAE